MYSWVIAPTPQKGVSGHIYLGPGVTNPSGLAVTVAAGLDTNNDGKWDLGYPDKFGNVYMPGGDTQAAYAVLGLTPGLYKIVASAPGLTPQLASVTLASSDVNQDFTLPTGGGTSVAKR
jgi:hypothetical protein